MKSILLKILCSIKDLCIFLYALFLLVLIPVFFFSYGGKWMHTLAENISPYVR